MKKCIAFQMKDAKKALKHINENIEIINDRNNYKYPLYTWDNGYRILMKCKKCGALILLQSSEFHSFNDEDSFYQSYFPVSSFEEANELNRKYDLKKEFNREYLSVKNSKCYLINN